MNDLILSIDLGTTGLKAVILSGDGMERARAERGYPIETPWPGAAEQDPGCWWQALRECCAALKARCPEAFAAIRGIGICGQMHTHVLLDAGGRPLRPAITWMDQRSAALLERLEALPDWPMRVFRATCNRTAPTYTAPNCLWLREREPEAWRAARGLLVAKDYLKYLLTGNRVTDPTDASGTLLFDVARGRWSEAMLETFRVDRALLPEVAPSAALIGAVTRSAAEATGLAEGTPVNNGCSDNSAAALGCGMTGPGQATLIIGTAGVVSVCSDRPLADPGHRLACWNYCLEDRWISLGVTQTAGESLNWFRRCFDPAGTGADEDLFQRYERLAAEAPPGAGGLVFLPYLNGERTPYWDPHARGVFFGINLETRKAHFIRAVMEGVCNALRNNLDTVESLGLPVSELRATGGGLRSRSWLESLARILRRPLRRIDLQEPGACGNAALCAAALGLYGSVREAAAATAHGAGPAVETAADPACERNYQVFLDLYQDLKERFRRADG